MDSRKLPGSLKAAILIQAMASEEAQKILNSLAPTEREKISVHLSQMGNISPSLVEKVSEEFSEMAASAKVLSGKWGKIAHGKSHIIEEDSKASTSGSSSLNTLRSLDADQLADMIKNEHPQTIAIIIVHIQSELGCEVLDKLPDELKSDVAIRIANLDKVISGMVEEIDKVFEDVLEGKEAPVIHRTGGVGQLAELLNLLDVASGEMILEQIEENDPEMAAQIKQLMFIFEDLPLVEDKGIQKVLRRVETKELAVALKAASEEVKEKIFTNMSERAGEMLREEIEVRGSVRMKEVEGAQVAITRIIQEMEQKGEIVIRGRRGEEYIE